MPGTRDESHASACLKLLMVPAVGLALVPKCPLCWMAYLGLVTGVSMASTIQWGGLALLTAALITSLTVLARGRALGERPLAAALLGSAVMLVGRFGLASPAAVYLGLGMLTMALIWNMTRRGRRARRPVAMTGSHAVCGGAPEPQRPRQGVNTK
jgi:hypothetical protein